MNYVIDISRQLLSLTETISLSEAKQYLRVTDTAQDNVITLIIKGAREAIEKATGLCLAYSRIKTLLNNSDGMIELPMMPINAMITTGLTFVGYEFLQLVNISEQIEVEYDLRHIANELKNTFSVVIWMCVLLFSFVFKHRTRVLFLYKIAHNCRLFSV